MNSFRFKGILSWLVTLLVPFALVLTAMRLMFSPLYLQYEYNAPGFPADRYGFTTQDRLYWARIAEEYLLNDAGIEFLGDLRFADGAPVYNERELEHMVDVKVVVQAAFRVWYVALAVLALLGVLSWRGGWLDDFFNGLSRGGWLTIIFLISVLVFVFFGFNAFFVAFHNVFFQPGTWMFYWSDTLIRLFPERFWRDIFILTGVLSIGGALVLAYIFKRR